MHHRKPFALGYRERERIAYPTMPWVNLRATACRVAVRPAFDRLDLPTQSADWGAESAVHDGRQKRYGEWREGIKISLEEDLRTGFLNRQIGLPR